MAPYITAIHTRPKLCERPLKLLWRGGMPGAVSPQKGGANPDAPTREAGLTQLRWPSQPNKKPGRETIAMSAAGASMKKAVHGFRRTTDRPRALPFRALEPIDAVELFGACLMPLTH